MINEQKIWQWIGALSLVLFSWVCFILFKSIFAWALIAVVAAGVMLLGNPRALFWVGLGWFMFVQYIQANFRVGFFGYIDEMVTLAMLGVLFFLSRRTPEPELALRHKQLRPLQKVAFLFIVLTVASAVVNHAVDIYLLMWCFQYLRMFVILFFAVRVIQLKDTRGFVNFMMIVSIIQFLLNLGWKLLINPLPNDRKFWASDFAVGTLNGCDSVAYFCVMTIILFVALALDPPSQQVRRISWGIILINLVDFMMTNTNHAYFMLLGALVIFFLLNHKEVLKIINPATLVWLGVLAVVFLSLFSMTDAGHALQPRYLAMRYEQFMEGPKVDSYKRNFTELPNETPLFWLLGTGPGQAGSCIGAALKRPISDKYFNVMYNEERYRQDVREGSMATGPITGILTYWSELGPLGLLMIVLTYFIAFSKSKKNLLKKTFGDKYQQALARSLPSIFAVVLMIALIRDLFYAAWLSGIVWVWAVLAMVTFSEAEKPGAYRKSLSAQSAARRGGFRR